MKDHEVKAVASKYPGWLLRLLKAVKQQHPNLHPNKLPPKKFGALVATVESFKAQLRPVRPAVGHPPPAPALPNDFSLPAYAPHSGTQFAQPLGMPSANALPGQLQGAPSMPHLANPLANVYGAPGLGWAAACRTIPV